MVRSFLVFLPSPLFQLLDASYNQLQDLPPTIGTMTSLVTLRLEHNQLEALPDIAIPDDDECDRIDRVRGKPPRGQVLNNAAQLHSASSPSQSATKDVSPTTATAAAPATTTAAAGAVPDDTGKRTSASDNGGGSGGGVAAAAAAAAAVAVAVAAAPGMQSRDTGLRRTLHHPPPSPLRSVRDTTGDATAAGSSPSNVHTGQSRSTPLRSILRGSRRQAASADGTSQDPGQSPSQQPQPRSDDQAVSGGQDAGGGTTDVQPLASQRSSLSSQSVRSESDSDGSVDTQSSE